MDGCPRDQLVNPAFSVHRGLLTGYCDYFRCSLQPHFLHLSLLNTLSTLSSTLSPLLYQTMASRFMPRLVRAYGTVQSPPSAGTLPSRIPIALQEATASTAPRTSWTRDEIKQIYETPLNQLTYAAVCYYYFHQ